MTKIADLMGALSKELEAQRKLDECRQHATGDVDYYCYGYAQDLQRAEETLEKALNAVIDQRIAAKMLLLNIARQPTISADVTAAA